MLLQDIYLSPEGQDEAQFPHPFPVEVRHHGTPLFAIEVHSKYSAPWYVKGNLQASPSVVKQPDKHLL